MPQECTDSKIERIIALTVQRCEVVRWLEGAAQEQVAASKQLDALDNEIGALRASITQPNALTPVAAAIDNEMRAMRAELTKPNAPPPATNAADSGLEAHPTPIPDPRSPIPVDKDAQAKIEAANRQRAQVEAAAMARSGGGGVITTARQGAGPKLQDTFG